MKLIAYTLLLASVTFTGPSVFAEVIFNGRVNAAYTRIDRSTTGGSSFALISPGGFNGHLELGYRTKGGFQTTIFGESTTHAFEAPSTRTLLESEISPTKAGVSFRYRGPYVSFFIDGYLNQLILITDIDATTNELKLHDGTFVKGGLTLQGKARAYEMYVDLYAFGPVSVEDFENEPVIFNYGLGAEGKIEFGRSKFRWGVHLKVELDELKNGNDTYTSSNAYGGLFFRLAKN